jgi:hypothetical protein
MDEFYKYNRKTNHPDNKINDFVGQMLDNNRDDKYSFRLPRVLKEKLEQEKKPANVLIILLAKHYYPSFKFIYDNDEWEEEVKGL